MACQYNHSWPLPFPSLGTGKPARFICIDGEKRFCARGQHKAYRSFKTLGWPSGQGRILLSQHLYYLEVISNLLGSVPCGKIPLLGAKSLPVYLEGLDWMEFSFSLKLSR